MEATEKPKIFLETISFLRKNIDALISIRPKCKVNFSFNGRVTYSFTIDELNSAEEFEGVTTILPAINTSLVIQSYSLFEASFERFLLEELNTENLTGIQEKVMAKYIDDVVKLSSENSLAEAFAFITEKKLKDFFSKEEFELYQLIKDCYLLRHLLVHGSSTKRLIVPNDHGGTILLDPDDTKYVTLMQKLITKFQLPVPREYLSIELLVLESNIVDYLINAVKIISEKFYNYKEFKPKYLKEDFFKKNPAQAEE